MSYIDDLGIKEKTVKIPVRVINGQLKYFYGGDLPELEEGTIGDLVLSEYSVKDKRFLEMVQKEEKEEILPAGSIIMVAVNEKGCPNNMRGHLKK